MTTLLKSIFLYKEIFRLAPNGLLPNVKLTDALKVMVRTGAPLPSLLYSVCILQ